jgi:transcription elongation factor Elf1
MSFQCPVCGYPSLDESPRSASGAGSYEICPSCGFQFGVTDDDRGISAEEWRSQWIQEGMKWRGGGAKEPQGWNPVAQLESIGIKV